MMKKPLVILSSSVVAVHLVFFFFNFHARTKTELPKKSIVVRTFTPPPKAPKQAVQKEKTAPIKKPSQKKALLKKLEKELSKIETTPPPETILSLPKKIPTLQIDTKEKEIKGDYPTLLGAMLKKELELPEQGKVKLELTVRKTGQVMKVRVLHALSEKNKRYLEINLLKITLPPFNEEMKNENEHTFILTFCNEN